MGHRDAPFDSGYEAAILSGAARWQAWLLKRPLRPMRMLGRFALFWAFAATNVAPALLFSTGGEGKIIGPAILDLAGGDALSRSQAAALALTAIVVNLAAIAVARYRGGTLPLRNHYVREFSLFVAERSGAIEADEADAFSLASHARSDTIQRLRQGG